MSSAKTSAKIQNSDNKFLQKLYTPVGLFNYLVFNIFDGFFTITLILYVATLSVSLVPLASSGDDGTILLWALKNFDNY